MTEHSLACLETLPDRIKQVLASPTCLSGALLTVLDALQIALNASRLDAFHDVGNGGPPVGVSSSLARERKFDSFSVRRTVLEGNDDHAEWFVEKISHKQDKDDIVRRDLIADGYRVTLTWKDLPMWPLAEASRSMKTTRTVVPRPRFQELVVWFTLKTSGLQADPASWRGKVEAIRRALERCLSMPSLESRSVRLLRYAGDLKVFGTLDDTAHRELLSQVLEEFDERLRWLLQSYSPEFSKSQEDAPFLAQYFWVKQAGQDNISVPAPVVPVFLPHQKERLKQAAQEKLHLDQGVFTIDGKRFGGPQELTAERAVEFIISKLSSFEMDSNSLFSAFPADTRMSVYLENWPKEPLQEKPIILLEEQKNLRHIFRELTKSAQSEEPGPITSEARGSQESADSTPAISAQLTLLSVPVLIGDTPLFVVQVNSLSPLSVGMQGVISDAIRSLGGIVNFELQRQALEHFDRDQRELESYIETYRIAGTFQRDLDSIVTLLSKSTLTLDDRSAIKNAVDRHREEIQKQVAKVDEFYKPRNAIDLLPVIERAVATIPGLAKKHLTIISDLKCANVCVEAVEELFIYVLQMIIVSFHPRNEMDLELKISVTSGNADGKPYLPQVVINLRPSANVRMFGNETALLNRLEHVNPSLIGKPTRTKDGENVPGVSLTFPVLEDARCKQAS